MLDHVIRTICRSAPSCCLVLVLSLVCLARPGLAQDGHGGLDAFHCYDVKAKFKKVSNIHLVDQFNDLRYDVTEARELCAPAVQNCGITGDNCEGEVPNDAATHLNRYQVVPAKRQPHEVLPKDVSVTTCLGTVRIDLTVGDKLMVPAAKDLSSQPSAPDPQSHEVDHFHCYDTKLSKGETFPKGIKIMLMDQFITQPKTFDVPEVDHLCVAADKRDEGVKHPRNAFLCYNIKVAKGQPKFKKVTKIFTNDQFGPLKPQTVDEDEICLPAQVGGSAEPVCVPGSCQAPEDCTTLNCQDGSCHVNCAGDTCACGGDCGSQFCDGGMCQPVCAGGSCVCGGDCTSQFCNNGTCAAVSAGNPCVCGGDCTSQNCQGNVCQRNCADGPCVSGGDCTSQFCNNGTCAPTFDGSCVCGGDCLSQFCDGGTCAPPN